MTVRASTESLFKLKCWLAFLLPHNYVYVHTYIENDLTTEAVAPTTEHIHSFTT